MGLNDDRRIVHVVYDCNPAQYRGGVARVVFELAQAQSATKPVEIWSFNKELAGTEKRHERVLIRYLDALRFGNVLFSKQLKEVLMREQDSICILHSHNTFHPINRQVFNFARRRSIPIFLHPHGAIDSILLEGHSLSKIKKKLYLKLVELRTLRVANGVIALTQYEKAQLFRYNVGKNVHVVPNGISIDSRSSEEQAVSRSPGLQRTKGGANVLYVGRIVKKKGLEFIIHGFSVLNRLIPNSRLIIAGNYDEDTEYTKTLKDQAAFLSLSSSITWLGLIGEAEKHSVFSQADLFIHASHSEGMAMSILEAMARECPVVATPGCHMDMAEAASAIIVCKQEASALGHAMHRILSNCDLSEELKARASDFVSKNHSWDVIAQQILDIYDGAGYV